MNRLLYKGVELPKSGSYSLLDFGNVTENSNRVREVLLLTDEDVKDIDVGVSCSSCTKASYKKITDNSYMIYINYDTSLLGKLNKNVYIYLKNKKGDVTKKLKINFTGEVKKK